MRRIVLTSGAAITASLSLTFAGYAADGVALNEGWTSQFSWRSIGPANMSGRIIDIEVVDSDHSVWYLSTASGGILKTTNNGTTFEHLFEDQPTVSIGDLAVSKSNPDIIYVGTGENNPRNSVSYGDGVYKSTDGGETWTNVGLKESFQVGRIAVHPTNPDIVYVGALGRLYGPGGERGLFKSTDGGETWDNVLYVDDMTGVTEVQMHPEDPDTLLVATYERQRDIYETNDPYKKFGPGGGIYKTTNGGRTFTKLTEGLPTVDLGRVSIDYYKANPDIAYAIVESALIGSGPAEPARATAYSGFSGVDADAGVRLSGIAEDGPADKAGLQEGDVVIAINGKRLVSFDDYAKALLEYEPGDKVTLEIVRDREAMEIELTFAERPEAEQPRRARRGGQGQRRREPPRPGSDADISSRPYGSRLGGQQANVQDEQGEDGFQYGGIYMTEDGGDSWSRINSLNDRPMYFSLIKADPTDNTYLYSGGVSMFRSVDGGETFTGDAGRRVHSDHHAMWIDPNDGRHMILAGDGGVYVSYDRTANWEHLNKFAIGQFYHASTDNRTFYNVYGGLQDNGSWGGPAQSRNGGALNEDWIRIGGGDGFICWADPNDPDQLYYSSQNGGTGRINLRTGQSGRIRPQPPAGSGERYRFHWKTPFALSHHNSKIYYSAGNYVFRSLWKGDDLVKISPEITLTERGHATAFSESPIDSDILYVGTDDGAMWATTDGGANWRDLLKVTREDILSARATAESAGATDPDESDPVSGAWDVKLISDRLPGDASFTLNLNRGEGGALTGTLSADMFGSGDLEDVSFEGGVLKFAYPGDFGTMNFEGEVGNGSVSGVMSAGDGQFSVDFEGARQAGGSGSAEMNGAMPFSEVIPGPIHVAALEASRHEPCRVYATLDGHRQDDDAPYGLVSEDCGLSWTNLTTEIRDTSTRALREDIENENVLYLAHEFGAMVSADRGATWAPLGDLPTVAVHDIAQHPTRNEIVVATHGRSLWVMDITALRQVTAESAATATLYKPNTVYRWRQLPGRGSTGNFSFRGENAGSSAEIFYSLPSNANNVSLTVADVNGETIRSLGGATNAGLHRVVWDGRRELTEEQREQAARFQGRGGRRGGRFGGPPVPAGTYRVTLSVNGQSQSQLVEIRNDPAFNVDVAAEIEAREAFEREMEEEENEPAIR